MFDPIGFVASTLSGAVTEEAIEPPVSQTIANRGPINVAPIGVNLGEILRPYNEGSLANGGFGLDIPSRYKTTPVRAEPALTAGAGVQSNGNTWIFAILAAMAAGGYLLLRK